ncbi:MAG: lipopolysaccharide heptosyltransferase II [Candidatus Omnitrophica bacterium]|nr:lipopolysaccharide heptosyltransferase II [Candidatus Omnitrophota bacterium]
MSSKILIARMDKIGDVVLSTPAIKAVRDAYPDSHIAVLVRPYAVDIVDGNPYINEVITYDKKGREKGLFENIRFILNLRRAKFDLAIILHPKNSAHISTFLAGIRQRVGYDNKMGMLLTRRIPHTKQFGFKHESDYVLDVLRYIGIETKNKSLYMPANKASEEKIRGVFLAGGISENESVVSMHPAASCPSRRWSVERFAKAADALADRHTAKIVIVAGPEDKASGDRMAALMKSKSLNLSGKTSIADLASVLRRSRLFISNDSGPVHVACAVGTPVISIFGRNDRGISPKRWGPIGKYDVALHKDVGCEVCLAHRCKQGFKCLEAISVQDVLSAAENMLRQK